MESNSESWIVNRGSKKKKEKTEAQEVRQCRYEKFEMVMVERQQINNAPYNPRTISAKAKEKLRKNLEEVGLIQPITWNRQTGNIVSGHQRISILDALEGTYEYRLQVAAVDLDEKTEKEQNIFMNNPDVQGAFDFEKLEVMVPEIDLDLAGLEFADIYKAFGDLPMNEKAQEALVGISNSILEMRNMLEKSREKYDEKNDTNFYLVVVFKNHEERKAFTDIVKAEDNRYIDGKWLRGLLEGKT